MPIDASIIGQLRTPEPIDPMRQMVSLANWRSQMESAAALREQREAIAQSRELEAEKRRRELADQDALGRAYRQPKITRESVIESLKTNAPHMVPDAVKDFDEADKRAIEIRTARANVLKLERDHIAGLAAAVAKRGYDPVAFELALQDAEALFEGQSEMIGRLRERAKPGPLAIKQIVNSMIAGSPEQAQIAETGRHNVANETTAAAAQAETARHNTATEAATAAAHRETARHHRQIETKTGDGEPLVAIIGDNNTPVLVPRSQAVGKRPASTREQGRSVTSGDANELADYDTSLSDLQVLRKTLTETANATVTTAKVGAALPNWATDLTGWGTNAKKRQGVIDRVKQVIGKTMEGGVLRKEDEYKYAKILPTIGDPPEVAASKLNGLETAITQRKATKLDALEDANYDVTRFRAREAAPAAGDGVTVTAPDGQVFRFKSKAEADGFKRAAGIR